MKYFTVLVLFCLLVQCTDALRRNEHKQVVKVEFGKTVVISCCMDTKIEEFSGFYDCINKKIEEYKNPNKYKTELQLGKSPNEICPALFVQNVDKSDIGSYTCQTKEGASIPFYINLQATLYVDNYHQTLLAGTNNSRIQTKVISTTLPRIVWSHRVNGSMKTVAIYDDNTNTQTLGLPKYEIFTEDGTLLVNQVSMKDSGLYEIKVIDNNEVMKRTINVEVQAKPSFDTDRTKLTSTEDDYYTLTIYAKARPHAELSCKLRDVAYVDGKLPKAQNLTYSGDVIAARFEFYTNATYLMCTALNPHGHDKIRIELYGKIVTLPPITSEKTIDKTTTLALSWTIGILIMAFIIGSITYMIWNWRFRHKKNTGDKDLEEGEEEEEEDEESSKKNKKKKSKKKKRKAKEESDDSSSEDEDENVTSKKKKKTGKRSSTSSETKRPQKASKPQKKDKKRNSGSAKSEKPESSLKPPSAKKEGSKEKTSESSKQKALLETPTVAKKRKPQSEGGPSKEHDKKPEKADKPEKTEKSHKTEKLDKTEKPRKTEKPEKADKPEKTEKSDKSEKSHKTEKLDKTEKPKKTEKSEKSEKSEKTDMPGKTEQTEKKKKKKKTPE